MTSFLWESLDIVFLDDEACRDETLVGGKASGLANLAGAFRVPPGFCITSKALRLLGPKDSLTDTLRESVQHAYELLGEKCGEIDPSVAVRSSAIGEDSATASFAGIHDSYLNVKGDEEVVRAVKDCVASAFSERAAEYRRRNLDSEDPQIAVIVQKMVPAEAAMVAFTTNPVTGSQEELVVNATLGLGEELASGRTTPDTYTIRKKDRTIIHQKISNKHRTQVPVVTGTQEASVPAHLQSSPALTDSQLSEVVELALQVEDTLGYPVDVEAAWANGQLFLLQARPITAGFPATLEGEDAHLEWEWEVGHFPTPTPPLAADSIRLAFEGADAAFREDEKPLRLRCNIINGYVYLALQFLVPDQEIPKAEQKIAELNSLKARGLAKYWEDTVTPRLAETFSWMQQVPLETLPRQELADAWKELQQRLLEIWKIHWGLTGPARKSLEDLASVYTSIFPEASSVEALKLVQGSSTSLNQVQRDLYELASKARRFPEVRELIISGKQDALQRIRTIKGGPEFQEKFEEFLGNHGHLGHLHMDLQQPVWIDEPLLVIGEVRKSLESDLTDPSIKQRRLSEEAASLAKRRLEQLRDRSEDLARLEAALQVAKETGPLTEEHNYRLDRMSRTHERHFYLRVGERLVKNSVIDLPDDIFFLKFDEVTDLILSPRDCRSKITARRKTLDGWKRFRPPLHLGKKPPQEGSKSTGPSEGPSEAQRDQEQYELKGESASLGVARGPARIVLDKSDFERVKQGDILVCHVTNPSWVPLFSRVAGLVSDEGGVLSHAAVLVREFGLPGVVGVNDATQRLRDGQRVEVNGDSGLVRILSHKN